MIAVALLALGVASTTPVPTLTQRVTDDAHVLSATDRARLDTKLAQYEHATGHQFAVLIIPTLGGDLLEQYSMKVAEQWRLGDKKRDDGLLMLIAMQEHAIRIEVGYGLEGAVPDVVASRVIRDVMVPKMRNNDVAGAIDAGMSALMSAAAGDSIGASSTSSTSSTSPSSPNAQRGPNRYGVGLGMIAVIFFVLLALPRIVRAPLFGVAGAVIGLALWSSLLAAIGLLVVGVFLGAVLPSGRSRGGFFPIFYGGGFGGGGGWSSSGGGGGFSGGGGGFGGGGASGRW